MNLKSKTAVVTGGATGIGKETVRVLAAKGARVISIDWNGEENEQTAAAVRASGGLCEALTGDVSSSADANRAFGGIGPVDILINNAATVKGDGPLLEVTDETWRKIIDVCLKSMFLCSKAALATMIPRRSGAIVNLASVNGMVGIHLAAYSAAKGGVIALTRVMAAQYGPLGIRVNTICPGTIMSENSQRSHQSDPAKSSELRALYPAGKFGTPNDIASAVLYLVSDEAAFVNGTTMVIDGALTAVRLSTFARPR